MAFSKKSVRYLAKETMQRLAYDPLEVLVAAASESSASPQDRREIAEFLMPYMYPKLSSVEVQAEVDNVNSAPEASELMRRILANPELADAAQKLSLEAAGVLVGDGRMGGPIQ